MNGPTETGGEAATGGTDAGAPAEDRAPWLARADWAKGRVVAERRRLLVVPWLVLGLSLVLFVPAIWLVGRQIAGGVERLDARFFVLIAFALVVFGFFGGRAFVHTRQALRYRPAVLHLEAVPIPIGGVLRGTIAAPVELRPDERVRLELECVVHVRGRGEDGGHEKTIWREIREVGAAATRPAAEGVAVPVEIPVAAHPPETGPHETGAVRWTLKARLLPGRRWREAFDLPVFRTAESPPIERREKPATLREALRQAKEKLSHSPAENQSAESGASRSVSER
jgi:hypothetical protein